MLLSSASLAASRKVSGDTMREGRFFRGTLLFVQNGIGKEKAWVYKPEAFRARLYRLRSDLDASPGGTAQDRPWRLVCPVGTPLALGERVRDSATSQVYVVTGAPAAAGVEAIEEAWDVQEIKP